jgi:hypothetical protein
MSLGYMAFDPAAQPGGWTAPDGYVVLWVQSLWYAEQALNPIPWTELHLLLRMRVRKKQGAPTHADRAKSVESSAVWKDPVTLAQATVASAPPV